MKKGLLYVNLGTPVSPSAQDVKKYLQTFLMDEYVLDMPKPLRWLLVNGIIAPFRSKKSAEAYAKIWTNKGSPLLFYSQSLVQKVGQEMGDDWVVELGMRYSLPSVEEALRKMAAQKVQEIRLVLAYPQYAMSSSETAIQAVKEAVRKVWPTSPPPVFMVKHYETHPTFIDFWANQLQKAIQVNQFDHILFSYHGLPVRHVRKISPTCEGKGACSLTARPENQLCYRRQSFATTYKIAEKVGLSPQKYSVGFQSRLSSGWIEPHSDEFYRQLPAQGVKKLLVLCPSFTVDCLETLEEVAIRGKEEFIASGGEDLTLIPCLNDSDGHVRLIRQLAQEANTPL